MTIRCCAASRPTGAREARHVWRCGRSTANSAEPGASVDRAIKPLVVERAQHRAELVAELPLSISGAASVVCILVLPRFHDGEVIGAAGLLHHFEALIAAALAACVGERIEGRNHLVLLRRRNVDVTDDDDRALSADRIGRADVEGVM